MIVTSTAGRRVAGVAIFVAVASVAGPASLAAAAQSAPTSAATNGISEPDTILPAPGDVTVAQQGPYSVQVSFSPLPDESVVAQYEVHVTDQAGRTRDLKRVPAGTTTVLASARKAAELSQATAVTVQVRAIAKPGPTYAWFGASSRTDFVMPAVTAPTITATALNADRDIVLLNWQSDPLGPPAGNVQEAPLEVSKNGGPWEPVTFALGSATSTPSAAALDALVRRPGSAPVSVAPGATYRFRVGVRGAAETADLTMPTTPEEWQNFTWPEAKIVTWGETSDWVVPQGSPLAAPTDLAVSATRSGKVTAQWRGTSRALNYRVQVKTGRAWKPVAETAGSRTTKKVATTLKAGQRVQVRVKATHQWRASAFTNKSVRIR